MSRYPPFIHSLNHLITHHHQDQNGGAHNLDLNPNHPRSPKFGLYTHPSGLIGELCQSYVNLSKHTHQLAPCPRLIVDLELASLPLTTLFTPSHYTP